MELYRDKFVLELGAGGALPSIIAALNGARKVWQCRLNVIRVQVKLCFVDSDNGLP